MKNVLLYLANAYYTLLDNANIQFNGSKMPIYDGIAPSTELGSYILISADRGAQPTGNKCTYQYQAQILIDVVVKNGDFGFVDSDTIADEIGQYVNQFIGLQVENFQVINVNAGFNNLAGLNPTEPVFRTLIRFYHNVVQST